MLAQHDGPIYWLEESDSAGCDIVCDGRSMPPALTDHTPLAPVSGCSTAIQRLAITAADAAADLLLNVHKTLFQRILHIRREQIFF